MSQQRPAKKPDDHSTGDLDDIDNGEKKKLRIRECMENLLVLNKIQSSLLSQMNKEMQ